jgi:hypothetical protein
MMGRHKNRPLLSLTIGLIALCVLLAVLGTGCGVLGGADADSPQRFLSIEGDVLTYVSFKTGAAVKNDAALPGDRDFEGVSLPDFLAGSDISGVPQSVWLISSGDGFSVKIDWEGAEKAYMIFSRVNGWSVVAPEHPVSVNAMDIDRILVVCEGSEAGLRAVRADGGVDVVPFGAILTSPMLTQFHFEGKAETAAGAGLLASEVYTRELSVSLADVYEGYGGEPFVVTTESGEKYLTDGGGRFVIERQVIDYADDTGDVYENVVEIQIR